MAQILLKRYIQHKSMPKALYPKIREENLGFASYNHTNPIYAIPICKYFEKEKKNGGWRQKLHTQKEKKTFNINLSTFQ